MNAMPNPQGPRRASRHHGGVPRLFLHADYLRVLLPGHTVLVGYLSILMAHSVQGKVKDRDVVTVDIQRAELADEAGVSRDTIKRWEQALVKLGILRQVATGSRYRILEILPAPAVPMRPVSNSMGGKSAPHCEQTPNAADCGKPVSELLITPNCQTAWGATVPPSGGQPCPPSGVSTSFKKKVKKVIARKRVTLSKRGGSEVLQTAHRLHALAKTEICSLIESGRSGRALGPRVKSEIVACLVDRWNAYGSPGTASASLERDFRRLLGFACKPSVNSPAAYLLKTLRVKDWKSDPDPQSQAAAITKDGPAAERPVKDLDRRSGGGFLDEGHERFERAVQRLREHPKAPAGLVARWLAIHPSSSTEANQLAVAIESQLLSFFK